mmetsp:Transcript_1242/g.3558  ORF Transcript_1242/g.3558 Transcript_1242/m.3558 type:complete len:236 (-) Transcript_1242:117-824(-)
MPEQAAYVFGFADRRGRKAERPAADRPLALTRARTEKDVVHADLVRKGYVVSHACRYGGDFVIYEAHPSVCHSSHTVRVLRPDECPSAVDVAGFCRVQGSVLKKGVFATVDPKTQQPLYVGLSYDAANSTDNAKKVERRLSRLMVESPKNPAGAAHPPFPDDARLDVDDAVAPDDRMDLDFDDDNRDDVRLSDAFGAARGRGDHDDDHFDAPPPGDDDADAVGLDDDDDDDDDEV